MTRTPKWASGRVGGWRRLPDIEEWPGGSYIGRVRRSSLWAMTHGRRSAMVLPENPPPPPVTTRVGMPSVWESTAWMMRVVLISAVALGQGGLGVTTYDFGGLRRERGARRPARATFTAGDVHRELDRLDELGA